MASNPKPPIVLTGHITLSQDSHKAGDIYIFGKSDKAGHSAISGRHTNFGYSGYFLGTISNGTSFNNFKLNKIIPYQIRYYAAQQNRPETIAQIKKHVLRLEGEKALYDISVRAYRIPHLEII